MLAGAYGEIRRIARAVVSRSGPVQLEPTELANEAVIRLILSSTTFENQGHMLATAARALRQSMIDELRKSGAAKRLAPSAITMALGSGQPVVSLELLDEAIRQLQTVSAESARIVELRFMLGMTIDEAAQAMAISPRTLKRKWAAARAWLHGNLRDRADGVTV